MSNQSLRSARTIEATSLQTRLAQGVQDALRIGSDLGEVQVCSDDLFAPARRPLVIDANMLHSEILRLARVPGATKLLTLAQLGFLHLLVAAHVVNEVDEHLEEWCLARGLDHAVARRRWTDELRPMVTVVTLTSATVAQLLVPGEAARLKILAESSDAKWGDLDDVPTAALALLVQAPLLSKDSAPLKAVYGPVAEPTLHARYLDALTAGGQLHVLGQVGTVSALIAEATMSGSYRAARGSIARIGPISTAVALAAVIAVLLRRKRGADHCAIRARVEKLGASFAELARFYSDSEASYATLMKPCTPRHEIAEDRLDLRHTILAETRGSWSELDHRR